MPYNVPPEQWTPEYAAQVMRIMQQGYAQNPDIPQTGAPSGLVPMGAPGSLTPPMPPMTPEMQSSRPSFAGPAPAPQAGAQAVAPAGGSVTPPSQGSGTVGAMPGGGATWQKVQQMLPMVAALAYGQNRNMRHMAPLALQMGQMQQQTMAQQQLAHVQSSLAKISQEKGVDAAKKYLTELMSNPQLSPAVANKVSEKLSDVSQQVNARDAVKKLTTGDPKKIMESLPAIYETLPADVATSLVKAFKVDDKVQFIPLGEQIFAANKSTGEIKEVMRTAPGFKGAEIGGDDVIQELVRMGHDAKDIGTRARQGDAEAGSLLQQAAENIKQAALEKEERGRRARLSEVDILGKAQVAAATTAARVQADAAAKMNIPVEMVERGDVVYDVDKSGRAEPYKNTPTDVQASGGKKVILSAQDYQKVGRVDAFRRNLDKLEQAAERFLSDKPGQNLMTAIQEQLQPALASEVVADFQAWQSVVLGLPGLIQGDNRVSNLDLQAAQGLRPDSWDTKATAKARIKAARQLLDEIRGGILGNPGGGPTPAGVNQQIEQPQPKPTSGSEGGEWKTVPGEEGAPPIKYRIKRQ